MNLSARKLVSNFLEMESLDAICLRHGTDKSSGGHDYASFYERWFSKVKDHPVRLLEMGVLGGNSLMAFDEYFRHPLARIYGIELESSYWRPPVASRMGVITGSQSDPAISATFEQDTFDIIIDDAGHFGRDQRLALELWLPKVKPGGIYIIEDLHAGYWPEYNNHGAEKIMSHLFGIVHEINCHGNSKVGNRSDCMADGWRRLVKCMTFHKSVVVIERA